MRRSATISRLALFIVATLHSAGIPIMQQHAMQVRLNTETCKMEISMCGLHEDDTLCILRIGMMYDQALIRSRPFQSGKLHALTIIICNSSIKKLCFGVAASAYLELA